MAKINYYAHKLWRGNMYGVNQPKPEGNIIDIFVTLEIWTIYKRL